MTSEIHFDKYEKRGAYHWVNLTRTIWDFNLLVYCRYSDLVNYLGDSRYKKILNVGCGDGAWESLLVKSFPEKLATGIDLSETGIRLAKEQFVNNGLAPVPTFEVANAYSLPFENKEFDAVVSTDVIEHVRYPRKMLREAYRVLKDEGRIIISTDVETPDGIKDELHVQEFSTQELVELMKKENFEVELIIRKHPYWLYKGYGAILSIGGYKFPYLRYLINFIYLFLGVNLFGMLPASEVPVTQYIIGRKH